MIVSYPIIRCIGYNHRPTEGKLGNKYNITGIGSINNYGIAGIGSKQLCYSCLICY